MPINPRLETSIRQNVPNLAYEISDDFIGVFDNVFPPEFCKGMIDSIEKVYARQSMLVRAQYQGIGGISVQNHEIHDESIDTINSTFYSDNEWSVKSEEFNMRFWNACYALYAEKYSIIKIADKHNIYSIKLQRTPPGGGYHVWHNENTSRFLCTRIMTFILYLNGIEDGGETEFLYLKKRIKPVEGRLLLWPAGFTHTHRGNPPLKETKYVLTGWLEL